MASTFTPNLNLEKPGIGDKPWHDAWYDNMDILDALFDPETLYIDNVNHRVGMGTVTPAGVLHTAKSNQWNNTFLDTYDDGAGTSTVYFRKSDTDTIGNLATTDNLDVLGELVFMGVDTGSNWEEGARIRATQDGNAGDFIPTELSFSTASATGLNMKAMLIDKTGNVEVAKRLTVGELIIPSGTDPAPDVEGALFLDTDASANGTLKMYSNGAWRTVASW